MQDQTFIGRQPIVDAKQQIIGYEFFFRHSEDAQSAIFEDDLKNCASVLLSTIDQMHDEWKFGEKLAFINMNKLMLKSELIELMPPKKTVLEILSNVVIDDEVIARCTHLKSLNYKISLDNPQFSNAPDALSKLADFIKIDVQKVNYAEAIKLFAKYNSPMTRLVAEKVETHEQFESSKGIGFKCFQGFYFSHPVTFAEKVINPSFDSVLHILNLVTQDADNDVIEAGFKRDATLTFKLLRYINSVGFGLSCEVQSLGHAFSILGRNQLYRWLTLLMVTAGENSTSPVLMKTSITRGRLTELLGEGYFEKHDRDNLFIVGVFSMLDAILKVPMDEALEKLQLPAPITDALIHREGMYAPFLKLTEACEHDDNVEIKAIADSLQLDAARVNRSHIEALAWAEALGI
ncbi:MAG TPA: diguanylate phosphodiesterase [Methylophilaceae bacterium]|nr:diguanylate phosphodiesterase [Methylophilaceae bacterium]HAJ71676.1 diguanylate phosphodiesterase [Methylophilaceae bacterium]